MFLGGDESDMLLAAVRLYATSLAVNGDPIKSEAILREQLAHYQKNRGSNDIRTASTMGDLALALLLQGKYAGAFSLLCIAVPVISAQLGSEHRNTLLVKMNHGGALAGLNRHDEAADKLREVLAIQTRTVGPSHRDCLATARGLANVLLAQGNANEAEPLLRATLETQCQVLGQDHQSTLETTVILASTLNSLGQNDEAKGLLERTVPILARVVDPLHRLVVAANEALASALAWIQIDASSELSLALQVNVTEHRCLFFAAEAGQHDTVKLWLEAGASVDYTDWFRYLTPLLIAARNGHARTIEHLLQHGAAVDQIKRANPQHDGKDSTVLLLTKLSIHLGLLDDVEDVDETWDPMQNAVVEPVSIDNGTSPLFLAAREGHLMAVQVLLAAGATVDLVRTVCPDVANVYGTPLMAAVSLGHIDVARCLLEANASVNSAFSPLTSADTWYTPLFLASVKGDSAMVKLLIGAGAEVTQWCRFRVSDSSSSEAVQDGVHFQDYGVQQSALFAASTHGHRDVVDLLLASGADPSGVHVKITQRDGSEDQYSILEYMAEIEHGQLSHHLATDVARVLLAAGANVDEVFGNDNETALVVAVRRGNLELIELLTNAKADAAAGKERLRLSLHPPPPPSPPFPQVCDGRLTPFIGCWLLLGPHHPLASHPTDQNDMSNWREQDHYKLLGLQNYRLNATDVMIRAAYKVQTIEQHPDKKANNDWSETDRALADRYYTSVKRAFEVLGDATQRRLYDSVDATDEDDVVPAKTKTDATFFKQFSAAFKRNKKWFAPHPSDPNPDADYVELPSLGGEDAPKEYVDNFYDVWYAAESWREFGYFDEETAYDTDSPEQKLWIEKDNKAVRKRKNKKEKARQLQLIDNALASDPRIKKHEAAAKQAKLDTIQANEDAARSKKEAFVKAEEDTKADEEVNAKSAQANGKAIKESAKRAKKAFVKACRRSGIFKGGHSEETEISEDVVTALKNETAPATLQA